MMNNVRSFCGLESNSTLRIIIHENSTFGRCFMWTALSTPSHTFFAVATAFLSGYSRRVSRGQRCWLAYSACLVSALLALLNVVEIVLNYTLHRIQKHPPAYILAKAVSFISWFTCFLLKRRMRATTIHDKQNVKCIIVFMVPVLVSSSFELQFVDQSIRLYHYSLQALPINFIGVLLSFTLNLVFFLICVAISLSKVKVILPYEVLTDERGFDDDIILGQSEAPRNIFSKLTFWWSNTLLHKGYKKQLENANDLFLMPDTINTKAMKKIFVDKLKVERQKELLKLAKNEAEQRTVGTFIVRISLFMVLSKCFGRLFYSLAVLKLLMNILLLLQPILVNFLINFVSNKNEPISHGYYYACAFLFSNLISVLLQMHYRYNMTKVALRVRASLISVIYQKALSVSSSHLATFSTGKIVSLMSTDADKIRGFFYNFHDSWSAPFQLAACMYLLYLQVGVAFLPPIGYCILILPIAKHISSTIKKKQMERLAQRDARIKRMMEILDGIRIIKYNVWEKHFAELVRAIRNKELRIHLMIKLLMSTVISLWDITASVMSILAIAVYVYLGYELTAAKVFTVMAVVGQLVDPLNKLSWNINALIDAWASLKRVEEFLWLPDMNLDDYYASNKDEYSANPPDIKIGNGRFGWKVKEEIVSAVTSSSDLKPSMCSSCCWGRDKGIVATHHQEVDSSNVASLNNFMLNNISIQIDHGQFVGITGKVGSGKSSLFASLMAEMEKYEGHIWLHNCDQGVAFVTQEPWIQHLSVRDNILFGQQYDATRYNDIIEACALNEDLALLPAGDLTEVGENGVNLSGGQKARISLARSVYQDKKIYFLDDPIAAVDAHVARHIYKYCIMGLLKGKTVVLCTHHVTYLRQADHMIILKDGEVHAQGSPSQLLESKVIIDDSEEDGVQSTETASKETKKEDQDTAVLDDGKLVDDEEKRYGQVAFKVYKLYWKSFGSVLATIAVSLIVLTQASRNVQDWWLSHWITNTATSNKSNTLSYHFFERTHSFSSGISNEAQYYLSIYGYIVMGYLFFVITSAFLNGIGSVGAARLLHKSLLDVVLNTPVAFFDVTPVGRILNRFSTDITDIDTSLPLLLFIVLSQIFRAIGTLILITISLPWFILPLIPLTLVYYRTQSVYRTSSRELKRIGAVARSPIYEHFTETLAGYVTIRAFNECGRFIETNEQRLDLSQRAEYNEQLAALWLNFRLDMIGVGMVTAVSLLAVLEHHFGTTNAGLVGLAITYSISITPNLGWLVTLFSETEKQMVRVERVQQYLEDTPQEEEGKPDTVSPQWPTEGRIVFEGVSFKYRENLPLALKDVKLEVKGGEKVGICGRTGSGKSTILKVLFNVVDISQGSVFIDGTNINEINHSILRSRMSIIPQDPFLFDDTVAKNLDPTEAFSSHEMMEVIEKCHLTKQVQDLGGLTGKIGEKGNNLSVGQKQLLCLARALLKKSKIICIDEATASVDFETDQLIQATIRKEFEMSTVLTIAHRINTIIECDRVIVMEKGRVAEMDSPQHLLDDVNSQFYALVYESSLA